MTDRELLELAAKAAGLNKPIWIDYERAISYMSDSLRPSLKFWNPLTDDGDALRLAVKLRLPISFDQMTVEVGAYDRGAYAELGADPYAATRRAIVQAAAEIGKKMLENPGIAEAETHASDCAVHNEPAYPAGPCDCKEEDAARYRALRDARPVDGIYIFGEGDTLITDGTELDALADKLRTQKSKL